jgi:hypothetical protein
MVSMFGVLQVFPKEVKVFMRENLSGANRVSSYFLARTLSEMPNSVIYPVIFGSIVYGMVGLRVVANRFFFFNLVSRCCVTMGEKGTNPNEFSFSGLDAHLDVLRLRGATRWWCWWRTAPCPSAP